MWMPSKNAKRVTDGTMHSVLNLFIYLYLFIRSYLQTWGDHSMRSIVLPWYPGGHVLSKMQGRHLYLQDRHGEGSQKKKHKAKNHEDCSETLASSSLRILLISLPFWLLTNIAVSSAYKPILDEFLLTWDGRSLIYLVKSNGPKMEPWGTPKQTGRVSDRLSLILQTCNLPLK